MENLTAKHIESLKKLKVLSLENDFEIKTVKETLKTLSCDRANVWLFNKDYSSLTCKACLCIQNGILKQDDLAESDMPLYFKFLRKNNIIISNNALNQLVYHELLEQYIIPFDVKSIIDVPVRNANGEIVGVVCFEHTKDYHQWQTTEVNYAKEIADMLSEYFITE